MNTTDQPSADMTADQMRALLSLLASEVRDLRKEKATWFEDFRTQNKCIADQHNEISRLRAELNEAITALPRHDNHHNALMCPYCNPDHLVLVDIEKMLVACVPGGHQLCDPRQVADNIRRYQTRG